jgi:hypothetical protein
LQITPVCASAAATAAAFRSKKAAPAKPFAGLWGFATFAEAQRYIRRSLKRVSLVSTNPSEELEYGDVFANEKAAHIFLEVLKRFLHCFLVCALAYSLTK